MWMATTMLHYSFNSYFSLVSLHLSLSLPHTHSLWEYVYGVCAHCIHFSHWTQNAFMWFYTFIKHSLALCSDIVYLARVCVCIFLSYNLYISHECELCWVNRGSKCISIYDSSILHISKIKINIETERQVHSPTQMIFIFWFCSWRMPCIPSI